MGAFILNPGSPNESQLKSKGLDNLRKDDVISLRMPGAGGYGDPLERQFDLINNDLKNGKVSAEQAVNDYQIVLNETGLEIDQEATDKIRKDK